MSLLLCCVRSAHKVSKLPVFSLELTLLTFVNSFHIIDVYIIRSAILRILQWKSEGR